MTIKEYLDALRRCGHTLIGWWQYQGIRVPIILQKLLPEQVAALKASNDE